jgi:hypothetical protein
MSSSIHNNSEGAISWLRMPITTPTVIRLAVVDLLNSISKDEACDPVLKSTLKDLSQANDRELERVKLFIDLVEFIHLRRNVYDREWDYAALTYCIKRQANYPMLKDLFKSVTRKQVKEIRDRLNMGEASPRVQRIPTTELDSIFASWKQICETHNHPIERWIVLGQAFPTIPLCNLYSAIVME